MESNKAVTPSVTSVSISLSRKEQGALYMKSLRQAERIKELKEANAELVKAGEAANAALFDLLKAYAAVQEHYGLAPEASPVYVAAVNASTRLVVALSKAGVR